MVEVASAGAQGRYARFATHLLAQRGVSDRRVLLSIITAALRACTASSVEEGSRAKDAVFDAAWVKDALTSTAGDALRPGECRRDGHG